MENTTILIRYLDSDGNQIYEQATDDSFIPENIDRHRKSIQAIGAPAIAFQATELEMLPLVLVDGDETVPEDLKHLARRYPLEADTVI